MNSAESPSPVPESASAYSPLVLRFGYDLWVLGISNRFAWKAPTPRLRAFFQAHVSARHLDVGVGTGYFLDHCRWPVAKPEITLLDVNPHTLRFVAQRIRRHQPATVLASVLEPLPLADGAFHSINLGFLLHCLPGPMAAKGQAFATLKRHLHPDGVLFGSTILPDGCNAFGAKLTQVYNARGIFGNAGDTLEGLRRLLSTHFPVVTLEQVGQVALFTARHH